MQIYVKFGALTLLLSTIMLTTIDGSQNSVQAQNITSTLLPSTLPPQDGTSTLAQESSGGEDALLSSSDGVSNDAPESGDVSESQEDASSSEGSNSMPIIPSPKSSDNKDESSSNSDDGEGNDESSGSSESDDGDGNNDNYNGNNNDRDSQDTSSSEDNDSNAGKKKYGRSQVMTQVNECGNGDTPMNVGCQNTASQIQGDDNRIQ